MFSSITSSRPAQTLPYMRSRNGTCSGTSTEYPFTELGQEYLLERGLFRRRSTGEMIERHRKAERRGRFAFPTWWHYDVMAEARDE